MKVLYGEAQYNASSQPNQSVIAKRPRFVADPFQGPNECGHYALKFTATYDGEKVIENIQNNDVSYSSAFPCCLWLVDFSFFPVINFINFFCLQPRIVDWNAEYMYSIVFNPSNQ